MKVSQAIDFHLQYHRANSKKNTIKTCEFVLHRFAAQFNQRDLASNFPGGSPGISPFLDQG